MKQTSFVVEIVLKDDSPVIIIREPQRAQVIKITSDPSEVSTFLHEIVNRMQVVTENSTHNN